MRHLRYLSCLTGRCAAAALSTRQGRSAAAGTGPATAAPPRRPTFADAFQEVSQGKFTAQSSSSSSSSSASSPLPSSRDQGSCSPLLQRLLPHSSSSPRVFPQHLFPNLETAKLALEKHRGDGIFDPILHRYHTLLGKQQSLDATTTTTPSEPGGTRRRYVHVAVQRHPVHTAMDAARVLPDLLDEIATMAAATRSGKAASTSTTPPRFLLEDAEFATALLEQLFLTAFFTMETAGTRKRHVEPRLPTLLRAALPHRGRFSHEDSCLPLSSASSSLLCEAAEICLVRLLLASPFSFHVAFEYLLRQRKLRRAPHVPLTLFRLWWVMNPDQVPLEVSGRPARPLPGLFDTVTREFLSVVTGDSDSNGKVTRARVRAYKAGVMSTLLEASSPDGARPPLVLTPELFYPHGQEAAYEKALQSVTAAALVSGEAKYAISTPLLPRVMQVDAAREVGQQQPSNSATSLTRLLLRHSIVPLACEAAPRPLAELECWLALCALMTVVGMLNASTAQLRRLPRGGGKLSAAKSSSPSSYLRHDTRGSGGGAATSYEAHMEVLSGKLADAVVQLVDDCGGGVPPQQQQRAEEHRQLREWSRMVFTAVSSSFEFSGALSPSSTHRPLTMSAFWQQLHHQCVRNFPHIFHAGSNAVATLFALVAVEGASGTAEGRLATGLMATHLGRETALSRWRASLRPTTTTTRTATDDVVSAAPSRGSPSKQHQKRTSYLLSRVLSSSSSSSALPDSSSGDGDGVDDGPVQPARSRVALGPVDRAAKDIQYPPHSFVSGCGGPTAVLAQGAGGTSEAHNALLGIRAAVLSIAQEHVGLPWLREEAQNPSSLLWRDMTDAETAALMARGQPSFYVLLKVLQSLATVGDANDIADGGPRDNNTSSISNLVAECASRDVAAVARPIVAGYVNRLAVQSMAHSVAETGAIPLLTTRKQLLDSLPAEVAWEKVVSALLWSGLPAGPVAEALLQPPSPEDDDATREQEERPWEPVFGTGSLAWSLMKHTLLHPTPEEEEGEGEDAALDKSGKTVSAAEQQERRAIKCMTLALSHLLAFAFQTPEEVKRPVLLSHVFADADGQLHLPCVLASSGHVPSVAPALLCAEEQARGVTEVPNAGDADEEDFNGNGADNDDGDSGLAGEAAQEQEELLGSLPVTEEGGDGQCCQRASGGFPIPSASNATAAAESASGNSEVPEKDELGERLRTALAGCPPASRHLYLSFLELLGVCVVATSPTFTPATASQALVATSLYCAVGYNALQDVLQSQLDGDGRVPCLTSPRLASALRQPSMLVKLLLFHLHAVPDVAVISRLVLLQAAATATAVPSPRELQRGGGMGLPRRVVSSLCQLLYHTGVNHTLVRHWRAAQPTLRDDHTIASHQVALAQVLSSAETSAAQKQRELTYFLGSVTLAAMEQSSGHDAGTALYDARDYYIAAFLHSHPSRDGALDDRESPAPVVGVVFPSQQLVSFATAAGAGAPQRALTWAEAGRGTVSGAAAAANVKPPFSSKADTAQLEKAVKAVEADDFANLFTD